MKIISLNLKKFSSEDIEIISSELKKEKVLVLPTDTIYGLSSLATSERAVDKIYNIKNRSKAKPLIVLVKSFCMIREYCYLNQCQYDFIKKELAKNVPITVILKSRNNLLSCLLGEDGGMAVRIPKESNFLMEVLKNIDKPLVSTSLNISGKKSLENLDNLEKYFKKEKPNFVIDVGKLLEQKPSKIVDLRDANNIKILRN